MTDYFIQFKREKSRCNKGTNWLVVRETKNLSLVRRGWKGVDIIIGRFTSPPYKNQESKLNRFHNKL